MNQHFAKSHEAILSLLWKLFKHPATLPLRAAVVLVAVYQLLKINWRRKSLKGKLVVVTGAAGGLGRELALVFARKGARVCLWDVQQETLEKTAEEVRQETAAEVTTYCCDIADRGAVYETARRVQQEAGHPYALVNNAGILSGQTLMEEPDGKIQKVVEVNQLAHFWTIKAFLPHMIEHNDGHLVTVSSAAGIFGAPRMVDYCSSKFGAVGLLEALRMELGVTGKTGVKTTCVCPGAINTALFKGYKVPFMPAMTPRYVAETIVDGMQRNEALVCMPAAISLARMVKGLMPVWLFDIMNAPQANAMSAFDPSHANKILKMTMKKQ